jgi:hypothetical protein
MPERFRPELLVHKISEGNFNCDFKRKHLDGEILKEEDLEAIIKLFGLDDRKVGNPTGTISCDEYHAHSFACHYYYSPEAGVIDRLINEIRNYQSTLQKINSLTQTS